MAEQVKDLLMHIYRLENVTQPYAWGSMTAIAELLGQPSPSARPEAELWMGTHPKGPSAVVVDGERILLEQLIERSPRDILGSQVAKQFGNALPYLFKVLAAARPLSIQAHPSKSQAVNGFKRENHQGKAMDDPERNYRDDNHKPEIICALTSFWGLNGFRSARETLDLLGPVCPQILESPVKDLKRRQDDGIRPLFEAMMTLSDDERRTAAQQVLEKTQPLAESSSVYRWMVQMGNAYPADMGILSPAILNLVCLEPGQAMFLPAGQLHAYLGGVGIELMANSDNVLRGGLTPKHVDVSELIGVVRFAPTPLNIMNPVAMGTCEFGYESPAEEFLLTVIRTGGGESYQSPENRSVEILLCVDGTGRIIPVDGEGVLSVQKGDSFIIPANASPYSVSGSVTLYKAAVPI